MQHAVIGAQDERTMEAYDGILVVTSHAIDHSEHAPRESRTGIEPHRLAGVNTPLIVVSGRPKEREAIYRMGKSVRAILLDGAARQTERLGRGVRRCVSAKRRSHDESPCQRRERRCARLIKAEGLSKQADRLSDVITGAAP